MKPSLLKMLMRRGEVWWVDFTPSQGGEVRKTRPAVIVRNDAANKHANRVQVVPLSSKVDKLYPCEARISFQDKAAKAMADQIMTVAKTRLSRLMGTLSREDMRQVEYALRIQLGLRP